MFEYRETQNIVPLPLENKEQLFRDLMNIEHSFTGRLDVMFSNQFFQEAVQLIVNSIVLFEKGYFDAAFYSLRQSLEISTTIVYFVDDNETNRKQELIKWKKQEKFPMHNQMLNELQKRKTVFADIKEKMNSYFDEIEITKQKLNKYVHKQGLDKFYVHRNHPFKENKSNKVLISDFNDFLIKSIGAIAVFRLAIDPFPLLLSDEAIYNRTTQLMTDAYSEEFIEKYIGENNINAYKQTQLYKEHFDELIKEEEMLPSVVSIVKDNYVDRTQMDEIIKQVHLLSQNDRIAVALFSSSEKIAKIYCIGGWHWYFSNVATVKLNMGFNSADLNTFKDSKERYNVKYEEAYLSIFNLWDEDYYMEHNEEFTNNEIILFDEMVLKYNSLKPFNQLDLNDLNL